MTDETPTTPEQPIVPDLTAPPVPPKSGIPPSPVPPVELPQDDPMPGAHRKGD